MVGKRSLRIQQTGTEGIMLGHEIFCHENVGGMEIFLKNLLAHKTKKTFHQGCF